MADNTGSEATVVAPRRAQERRRASGLTVAGIILIALGVGAVGWMGWQYFGTNVTSTRQITTTKQELREVWSTTQPTAAAKPSTAGQGLALVRIPALDRPGEPYEQPVVVGTGEDALARGIGWYTETARPGQMGNFAIAGHRITHGEPFARLMELKVGDKVIVETAEATYTYQLFTAPKDKTVKDTETWVLDPDPMNPGRPATKAMITLTTCTDLFASPQRSVGFGNLIDTQLKHK